MEVDHFKKYLRSNQTPEEMKLWYHLRARRFHGFKFRRQVRIKQYIVDFVCYERQLIIEVDGGQHNEIVSQAYDTQRSIYLQAEGFKVIRFWNHEINQSLHEVLDIIAEAL